VDLEGHAAACHFWKEIAQSGAAVPDFASMPANPRLDALQAAFGARASCPTGCPLEGGSP
jgi:hypothetical protein